MKSIVEIFGEIVSNCSEGLEIAVFDGSQSVPLTSPSINYIFGNSQYIKEMLDDYTKADDMDKFPLVALFTPITETRGDRRYLSEVSLNIIIACSTSVDWSNESRLQTSFKNILHPLYERLMDEIRKHPEVEVSYDGSIEHTYSENYSYGRYGAYTDSDEKLGEPIDAIDIRNLKIKIHNHNCTRI